jgi:hypothetical protein
MIELAGVLYSLAKELGSYLSCDEEEKLVDIRWPETSGFKSDAEKIGYRIAWSTPEKIESRKLAGFEVLYEIDKLKRIRRRIFLRYGLKLIGKIDDAE